MPRSRRLKLVTIGLASTVAALTLLPSSGLAGADRKPGIFAQISDDDGKVKGDVTQKGREGFFTVKKYSIEFSSGSCTPLVMTTEFNSNWGRLSADRGEILPVVKLNVYKRSSTNATGGGSGVEKLELTYDLQNAQLNRVSHSDGDELTLTISYDSVDLVQRNRTDSITCVS